MLFSRPNVADERSRKTKRNMASDTELKSRIKQRLKNTASVVFLLGMKRLASPLLDELLETIRIKGPSLRAPQG